MIDEQQEQELRKQCTSYAAFIREHIDSTKKSVACYVRKENDEDEKEKWGFYFKFPSSCWNCEDVHRALEQFFGSVETFVKLPFVRFHGQRLYSFRLGMLELFAEKGANETKQAVADIWKDENNEPFLDLKPLW